METSINIGDKSLNIRIKLGTFKRLKEITGVDGIEYVKEVGSNPVEGTTNLLLAAVKTYDASHNTTQITDAELIRLVDDEADMSVINDVIGCYVKFLNPDGQGEETAKEVSPSPSQKFKN